MTKKYYRALKKRQVVPERWEKKVILMEPHFSCSQPGYIINHYMNKLQPMIAIGSVNYIKLRSTSFFFFNTVFFSEQSMLTVLLFREKINMKPSRQSRMPSHSRGTNLRKMPTILHKNQTNKSMMSML